MDTRMCAAPGCGNPLPPERKLEDFCTYACRGQFKVLEATGQRTGLKCFKNPKQNKALQSLKRQSVGRFSFARINSCTYRLDRPGKLAAVSLIEVGWPGGARQRWIARVGNRATEPLALYEAKRAAVAMLRERRETEHPERARSDERAFVEGLRGKEEGIQERGEVESASTNSEPPESPSYGEAQERVSGYCVAFHWDHLTEPDFDAAVAAEMKEVGSGRAVIDAAAQNAWQAKRKGQGQ